MKNKMRSIALDGPSGAGKSTLAKRVAEAMNYRYVDTGAIYRTVGLAAQRAGVDPSDGDAVGNMLRSIQVTLDYDGTGLQRMYLQGEDVSEAIRQNVISRYASQVSALPAVRDFLLDMQRDLARRHNVVMDGRDIGTVVLPEADVKIYLTATSEARAKRRYDELLQRGQQVDYDAVLQEVIERDRRDTQREIAPLRQAEDAVLVDTTELDLDQSFQRLMQVIEEKLNEGDAQ